MKSFLGLVSYFREHIPNHTEIVAPLQEMITGYKPRQRLQWSQIQERCFETAKEAFFHLPRIEVSTCSIATKFGQTIV
jgi:hypothetical protein